MGDYRDNRPSTFILEKPYIYTRKIDKIDDWVFFRGNRPSTPFPQVKKAPVSYDCALPCLDQVVIIKFRPSFFIKIPLFYWEKHHFPRKNHNFSKSDHFFIKIRGLNLMIIKGR